jgi:hypothetical protein
VFPSTNESRRLRRRISGQLYHNQGFFLVTAAVYALVAMAVPADRIFASPTGARLQIMAGLLPVTLAGLGLFTALYAFTVSAQVSRRRKRAAAALHTLLHLAVVVGVVDLFLHLSGIAAADPWMRAVLGGAVGALLGPLVVALYLVDRRPRTGQQQRVVRRMRQRGLQELPAPPHRSHRVDRLPDRRPAPRPLDVQPRHTRTRPQRPAETRRMGRPNLVPADRAHPTRTDRKPHPHTP